MLSSVVSYPSAPELGEQLLSLAQRAHDPAGLTHAPITLGNTLSFLRELAAACTHLEQGVTFYNAQQPRSQGFLVATHEGVCGGVEVELYRLKGELLLTRSSEHRVEAANCFRQALQTARRRGRSRWSCARS
jgi:hypothetical protein